MRRQLIQHFRRDETGSAILEFALVLPVLIVLAVGSFGLGQVLFVQLVLERAVESGARHLARVREPTCIPSCSAGARHAMALTRGDILNNSRLRPEDVKVAVRGSASDPIVALGATVSIRLDVLAGIGLPMTWTLSASHEERRVVE